MRAQSWRFDWPRFCCYCCRKPNIRYSNLHSPQTLHFNIRDSQQGNNTRYIKQNQRDERGKRYWNLSVGAVLLTRHVLYPHHVLIYWVRWAWNISWHCTFLTLRHVNTWSHKSILSSFKIRSVAKRAEKKRLLTSSKLGCTPTFWFSPSSNTQSHALSRCNFKKLFK